MEMEELMGRLKVQIIDALNLKHLSPNEIGDDQPLFVDGLGLDSIDALELIVLLQQYYNIQLEDPKKGPEVFRTVKTIAHYIQSKQ